MTPNSTTKEMEHRRFMQKTLNHMMKEDSSLEPFDYFMKNIRKFLFLDETPENNNDRTLRFGSQRTPKQTVKRIPSWTKNNNTNSDELSEEERNRLMKEGRCFKCKKRGHRVRDCPSDEDQSHYNEAKKITIKDLVDQVKAMTKEERMELVELMKEEEKSDLGKQEEELDSMKKETVSVQISPSLD